ncbi:MAG TPA: NAD(P)/FAD-dependent oxidoreductase [Thermoanaerobaculia bacterium]
MPLRSKKAVVIGAGPAGLTAAFELLTRTDIQPIVLEATDAFGGISRTVNYKGNRIDIGGHRFFSKSDRVMKWWLDILPLQQLPEGTQTITYHRMTTHIASAGNRAPDPDQEDKVMLLRARKSRIYFARKFFDYPISLSPDTVRKLGIGRTLKIGLSYLRALLFRRKEKNLEDFFINRFGRELYLTFFKSYTEKVWGVPCTEISAEWGAQRIKGLSILKAIIHFFRKTKETSLIDQFLYPKHGPGQMWDEVARIVREKGGEIHMRTRVTKILRSADGSIRGVVVRSDSGDEFEIAADYLFSSMPVRSLVRALEGEVPESARNVAEGLVYRDFVVVGVLLKRLLAADLRDNWIYIQEPDVLVGRLQVFNNWSPYMVADPNLTWIGMEYFCNATDPMWSWPDEKMLALAVDELARMKLADLADALDGVVIRVPKTYPAYFGAYEHFERVREFTDTIPNLFLIGRNGMHRYNNQDHSMLTAMVSIDNILAGRTDKSNVWEINTEEDYHEEK